jgi:hypothetical protein
MMGIATAGQCQEGHPEAAVVIWRTSMPQQLLIDIISQLTTATFAYCLLLNIWLLHWFSHGQKSCKKQAEIGK